SGFVQSMTIFSDNLEPACRTAASVAAHGVASTTISPTAAAVGTSSTEAPGPRLATRLFTLGSSCLGTPKTISWRRPAQARPSAPPTFPAPRIAIFISLFLHGAVLSVSPLDGQLPAPERFVCSRSSVLLFTTITPNAQSNDKGTPVW